MILHQQIGVPTPPKPLPSYERLMYIGARTRIYLFCVLVKRAPTF